MKLLVTGGAGFIGANFILYWLKHHPEDHVVNLDKLTYAGNLENLKEVEENPHYSFIQGDITEDADVEKAMDGAEVVVHFAAESHNDRAIMAPDIFVKTNVLGTHTLLRVARKNKIKRFHHISTDEVFGHIEADSDKKWTEESPYEPRSPYSASKAGSDHLVRAYFHTYALPITITNCTNNFGPYQFPEKYLPLAITNVLEGKKIPIYSPGNQVRDWLYVEDHCRAIDIVLEKGVVGETYLVGSEHREYPNLEVAKLLLNILGKGEEYIEFVKDRPGHDVKYAVNSAKLKQLGWKPQHSFEEWLEKTVKWYVDNQDWWQRVKSGAYQDYYTKQYGTVLEDFKVRI
jgi:dTDP-glucose 4,6-dehydratase